MKKNKKLIPLLCILASVILFIVILSTMIKGNLEDLQNAKSNSLASEKKAQKLKQQAEEIDKKEEEEKTQLNSIKPVLQEPSESDGESLSVFGEMFDRIISISKENGLLLRSLEYEKNPAGDPVYQDFSDFYNVCELKFFFVGTYAQLRSFLNAIINNFKYLVSISQLNITAFSDNTDYILINMSITLYSKKAHVTVTKNTDASPRAKKRSRR